MGDGLYGFSKLFVSILAHDLKKFDTDKSANNYMTISKVGESMVIRLTHE